MVKSYHLQIIFTEIMNFLSGKFSYWYKYRFNIRLYNQSFISGENGAEISPREGFGLSFRRRRRSCCRNKSDKNPTPSCPRSRTNHIAHRYLSSGFIFSWFFKNILVEWKPGGEKKLFSNIFFKMTSLVCVGAFSQYFRN